MRQVGVPFFNIFKDKGIDMVFFGSFIFSVHSLAIVDVSRETSARHNLGGKSHSHDTSQAIQTILNSLVPKQSNNTEFSCPDNGTYPHPWDCSKYFLCEKDGEVLSIVTRKTILTIVCRLKSMNVCMI